VYAPPLTDFRIVTVDVLLPFAQKLTVDTAFNAGAMAYVGVVFPELNFNPREPLWLVLVLAPFRIVHTPDAKV
jgi:hypothetical protein